MKLGMRQQPRNSRGRFVSRDFVRCTGHGRTRMALAFSAVAFLLCACSAIAHADEPTPASPAHVVVSFSVGVSTVKSAEHNVPGRVSYCAIDSRGTMTCGAPITMGKISKVEHK